MNFKRVVIYIIALCLIFGGAVSSYGASVQLKAPSVTLSTVKSTGKTKVAWKKVNKAVSYKVYTSTNNKTWSLLKTTKTTSVTHSKAVAGKKYYYKVKAIAKKSKNNSKYSAVKSKVCQYKYPITVKVKFSGISPKLTWNGVSGAKKYKIERSYSKSSGYSTIKTTTNRYYTDARAKADKKVYYRITALNSKGKIISKTISTISIKTKPEILEVKYVAIPSVPLYVKDDDDSDSVKVPYMTEVKIGTIPVRESTTGDWYRVYYKDKTYYVWIANDAVKFTSIKSTYEYTSTNRYQQEIIDLAKEIALEWDTYYDTTSLRATNVINSKGQHGFDCSGFAVYVLSTVMEKDVPTYKLSTSIKKLRDTTCVYNEGIEGEFKTVKPTISSMQPGDVIFFSLEKSYDHCGVYLGNGEFAQASKYLKNDAVSIMPLNDFYKEGVECVRRYIPNPENVKPANKIMTIKSPSQEGNGCYSYTEMTTKSNRVRFLYNGEKVILLYTYTFLNDDDNNYGYVRTEEGEEVFVLLKNLI